MWEKEQNTDSYAGFYVSFLSLDRILAVVEMWENEIEKRR